MLRSVIASTELSKLLCDEFAAVIKNPMIELKNRTELVASEFSFKDILAMFSALYKAKLLGVKLKRLCG